MTTKQHRETSDWIMGPMMLILLVFLPQCFYPIEPPVEPPPTENLEIRTWAYQLQDADPAEIAQADFDLIVMDYSRDGSETARYSAEEIQHIRTSGTIPIAYLSIGEAEDYRFYWDDEWFNHPPVWLGRENPEWEGNYPVRFWYTEWKNILYTYLDKIVEQGFAGIYLDRIDVVAYWSDPHNGEDTVLSEAEAARRMIALILDLAHYARSKTQQPFYIIPQNGEQILAFDDGAVLNAIAGWAAEDLFYDATHRWSSEDSIWIAEHRFPFLDRVLRHQKPILSVDYVDDGSGYTGANHQRIDDYRKRAQHRGYIPYVARSDRALDELNIIPGVQP